MFHIYINVVSKETGLKSFFSSGLIINSFHTAGVRSEPTKELLHLHFIYTGLSLSLSPGLGIGTLENGLLCEGRTVGDGRRQRQDVGGLGMGGKVEEARQGAEPRDARGTQP